MSVTDPLILVLCTGNICRSPMAEVLMRQALARRGIAAQVVSRGLDAPVGQPAHVFARATAQAHGLPIADDKRSTPVHPLELRRAAVILVMDAKHRQTVLRRHPQAGGKCFLLRHWLDGADVIDPLRAPAEVFEDQWLVLQAGCERWVERLLQAGLLPAPAPARPARSGFPSMSASSSRP